MLKEWPLREQNRFATTLGVLRVAWTLGDVVRKLRSDRGWTQTELGKHADLHQTAVNRLERNSDKSERATIERVARALNVSAVDLYAYAEELSLASELTDLERRNVQGHMRRLIEKRQLASSPQPAPTPQRDPLATKRESSEPVQRRRRR